MNEAHVGSLQLLATPFREDTPQPFAFGPGSTWAGITAEIRERISTVTTPSHAATSGNVLTQQVRILDLFCEQVLTNPVNNRKLSVDFIGIEVTGDSGPQKVVGWCHRELPILYGFIVPHRTTKGKRILERSTVTYR